MIHRGNWWQWLILAAVFAAIVPAIWSIVVGIVFAIGYVISLQLFPDIFCRACSGAGRRSGSVFGYSRRQCLTCGGQGRHRRLGNVMLNGGRQVWAERRGEAARERRRSRPL